MTDGDEAVRLANCAGKEQLTASIAKNIVLRHKQKGRNSHAYKCSFCNHWHVGSANFGVSRVRKKGLRNDHPPA